MRLGYYYNLRNCHQDCELADVFDIFKERGGNGTG